MEGRRGGEQEQEAEKEVVAVVQEEEEEEEEEEEVEEAVFTRESRRSRGMSAYLCYAKPHSGILEMGTQHPRNGYAAS